MSLWQIGQKKKETIALHQALCGVITNQSGKVQSSITSFYKIIQSIFLLVGGQTSFQMLWHDKECYVHDQTWANHQNISTGIDAFSELSIFRQKRNTTLRQCSYKQRHVWHNKRNISNTLLGHWACWVRSKGNVNKADIKSRKIWLSFWMQTWWR